MAQLEWLQNMLDQPDEQGERLFAHRGTTRENYLRSQAHHEAGHAVLAVALGFRMRRHGQIILQGSLGATSDIKLFSQYPELCAVVLYAGYCAEKYLNPRYEPMGCSSTMPYWKADFERARDYCAGDEAYHDKLRLIAASNVERRWPIISALAAELLNKGRLDGEAVEGFIRAGLDKQTWPVLPPAGQTHESLGPWYFLAVVPETWLNRHSPL